MVVEVDELPEAELTDETKTLAAEYKKLVLALLQRREAWQLVDAVNQLSDPPRWPTPPGTPRT